ncbi:MAG: DUF1833 family protein [Rubrivivax sp.]
MPTYQPKRNGVAFSVAHAEAIATSTDDAIFDTLEFRHPAFLDENGANFPVRLVRDHADLVATLEADAPVNPGAAVTFKACPFDAQLPNETDGADARALTLQIDGVSQLLVQQLDRAIGDDDSVSPPVALVNLTYRPFVASDLSGPAMLPVIHMELRDVRVTDLRVTARAIFFDPANRGFPAREYTAAEYPSLNVR